MAPFAPPRCLVVREVSERYAECEREDRGAAIDVGLARRQHEGYVAALRSLGLQVRVLTADAACPDTCFIEDTAVVLGRSVLATCPGAISRRPEVPAVAEELARERAVVPMQAPATLDGGDVLRVGRWLFAGLSARTNREGIAALEQLAAREGLSVVAMEVRAGLHLKSACTLAASDLLLYDAEALGREELATLRAHGLECVAAPEGVGANVLALGDAVLVSAAAPKTARWLVERGRDVRIVDVGEFHKGDGALTCLSLRIPQEGCWST